MKRVANLLVTLVFLAVGGGTVASPVTTTSTLKPDLALKLATATRAACRAKDFQVTVAVVDRSGLLQVLLRDQLAGNFTVRIAGLKAATAAGFRQATLGLNDQLTARSELRSLDGRADILMVGGGVPVEYNGQVVGAIGVSGAPTPDGDHDCAVAGIEALADELLF